jgi:hypothetical protein
MKVTRKRQSCENETRMVQFEWVARIELTKSTEMHLTEQVCNAQDGQVDTKKINSSFGDWEE